MPRLLDLPQGERKSLAKLKKMVQDDPELQPENISEERKQELIDDLMEAQGEKKAMLVVATGQQLMMSRPRLTGSPTR